jgi:septal ring factor EnvC (AmiA/AmiB activator)
VVRDEKGEIYTVRYGAVNAMLLNEFLREHSKVKAQKLKVQEQEATIAQLKSIVELEHKELEALATHLKEQDSRIEKVSSQIQTTKSGSQIAFIVH